MIEKIKINKLLSEIEQKKHICIYYACESGSRAWGFPSVDSDYDVRFLYIHPTDWYLSIEAKQDVIERPIDDQMDLSGWEIRTINDFLASEIVRLESRKFDKRKQKPDVEKLNELFRLALKEVWETD
jgi:predicted nucleotidyltransferase